MKNLFPTLSDKINLHYLGPNCIVENPYGDRHALDEMQTDIIELCDGSRSLDLLYKDLFNLYEIEKDEEEQCSNLINEFIENMIEIGVLQYKTSNSQPFSWISGERYKHYPQGMDIDIASLCNLQCTHCIKNADNRKGCFIDLNLLKKLAALLKSKTLKITMTGGEPLLHPKINEILAFFVEDFKVSLITNATLVERVDPYFLSKLSTIQVSLYGIDPTEYGETTINPELFHKFEAGLEKLVKVNENVILTLVLNQQRKDQIEDYIKFAVNKGVKHIRFGLPLPLGRAVSTEDNRDLWSLTDEDLQLLNHNLLSLREKYSGKITIPTLEDALSKNRDKEELDTFFNENFNNSLKCGAGISSFTLTATGNLTPCEMLPEEFFTIGTMEQLDQIIEGNFLKEFLEEAKTFKKNLNKNGISPSKICRAVEHLMEQVD